MLSKFGPEHAEERCGLRTDDIHLDAARNQRQYVDPLFRIREEGALSAQALQAQTAAERTLIDARRAEIEVMASTGQAAQAAAKSLTVWNDAIAASNKRAEDAVRSVRDDLSLSGLPPYQRRQQEIKIRARDLRRDTVTGPISSLSSGYGDYTALDPYGDLGSATNAFGGKRGARITGAEDALRFAYNRKELPPVYDDHFAVPAGGASAIGSYASAARRFAPGNIAIPSTASGNIGEYVNLSNRLNYKESFIDPISDANKELERSAALLRTRAGAFGQDTDALNKAVAAQEMWNKLNQAGLDTTKLSKSELSDLTTRVDGYATRTAKLQKQQEDFDRLANASNSFQNLGNSVVSNFGSDFGDVFNAKPRDLVSQLKQGDQAKYYAGQLSGSAVKQKVFMSQAGNFLRNIAFQQSIGLIQKGLFGYGQYGSPGYQSGVFGGLFNGLLGSFGGSGGSGGYSGIPETNGGLGSGGGLFGWLGSIFPHANGGVMTSAGPMPLRRYAAGGVANSPQLAMYGEGSKPEAYVPLPDGRRIPVNVQGSGGNAPQISLGGHTIVVQGSADEKTIAQFRAELAVSNRQMVYDLQRNFGQMNAKWQQRNGS